MFQKQFRARHRGGVWEPAPCRVSKSGDRLRSARPAEALTGAGVDSDDLTLVEVLGNRDDLFPLPSGTRSELARRFRLDTIHYMNLADGIRAKVAGGTFEFSQHALDQSVQRRISVAELREVIACCEVIENYPNDKYGPSCLVLGGDRFRAPAPCPVQPSLTASDQDHHAPRA